MLMKKILLIISFLIISSCSNNEIIRIPDLSESISSFAQTISPKVFKTDINQGSVLRTKNFEQVKQGMTKEQVLNLIGSPSVTDIFHKNQWEYIHNSTLANGEILFFRISLKFAEDKITEISIIKPENIKIVEEKNLLDSPIPNSEMTNAIDDNPWYKFW